MGRRKRTHRSPPFGGWSEGLDHWLLTHRAKGAALNAHSKRWKVVIADPVDYLNPGIPSSSYHENNANEPQDPR